MTLKLTGHGWKRRHDAGRPREVNLCGDDVGRHPVQKFPLGPVEHDRVQSALPQVPQPPHVGDLRERRHSLPPWRALSVELHPLPQPLLLRNLLRHRRAALLERLDSPDERVRRGVAWGLQLDPPTEGVGRVVERIRVEEHPIIRGILYDVVAPGGGAAYTDALISRWGEEGVRDYDPKATYLENRPKDGVFSGP